MRIHLPFRVLTLVACLLACVATANASAATDLTGTWQCCGAGGAAAQNFVITSGQGALAGRGELPSGQVFSSITGSVSGTAVTIVTTYNSFAPGYVATFVGTLGDDGHRLSGTWTSNRGQSGSWTATRAGGSISGRILKVSCGVTSCKRGPAAGVVVSGAGPQGTSATATTDPAGKYELSGLTAGAWIVTPQGDDFDPDSRTVELSGSAKDVDFEACAGPATAKSALEVTSVQATSAAICPPDEIDWLMEKRFTAANAGRWDADGLPSPEEVNPTSWTASLYTRAHDRKFACGANVRFIWTVTPAARLVRGKQPKVGCKSELHVTRLGTYTVTAQLQRRRAGSGVWRNLGKPVRGKVEVRDWLIVGMGDSNGSGEGNAPFYYKRCNRSVASYQLQTAIHLERRDPHSSVTFIHTSCSGASTDHLVSSNYAGTREASPPLEPQITQVQRLLAQRGAAPRRDVDAALISIGVNDLAFGPTLKFCLRIGLQTTLDPPCHLRTVRAVRHKDGKRTGGYVEDPAGVTLAAQLQTLQDRLEGRYGGIQAALPKLRVRRDRVFLAQYPDFSYGDDGNLCGIELGSIAHFLPSTWAWLSESGAVLNQHVRAAAAAPGRAWVVPDYDLAAFRRRGYCSTNSLFRSVGGALSNGDLGGPFHPNGEAHRIESAGTLTALCRKLYDGDATCNEPGAAG